MPVLNGSEKWHGGRTDHGRWDCVVVNGAILLGEREGVEVGLDEGAGVAGRGCIRVRIFAVINGEGEGFGPTVAIPDIGLAGVVNFRQIEPGDVGKGPFRAEGGEGCLGIKAVVEECQID